MHKDLVLKWKFYKQMLQKILILEKKLLVRKETFLKFKE